MLEVIVKIDSEILNWQLRLHSHIKVFNGKCAQVLLEVTILVFRLILRILVDQVNRVVIGNSTCHEVPESKHAEDNNLYSVL